MKEKLLQGNVELVLEKIEKAKSVLILTSKPVDADCIGTGLAVKWWMEQLGKEAVDLVSFFGANQVLPDFWGISQVRDEKVEDYDFSKYDLIILVDGSVWSQFFGMDTWETILEKVPQEKVILIDHHMLDDTTADLGDRSVVSELSSAAEVLYWYLMRPSGIPLDKEVADYLYSALVGDTRGFTFVANSSTFHFAAELVDAGADHDRYMDVNVLKKKMEFMAWAIQNTEFNPKVRSTFLLLDEDKQNELKELFGEDWANANTYYKFVVIRKIKGYDYGFILKHTGENSTRFSWRTRNYGETVEINEVAKRAGFTAGGHRNAGGGHFTGTVKEARDALVRELRRALNV